jgi:F0F1-type ATP synthase assembly protein I
MPKPGNESGLWAQVAYYSGLGFIIPSGAVVGVVVGWELDRLVHTAPVLEIALGVAGGVAGFIELLRVLKRAEKRQDKEDDGS